MLPVLSVMAFFVYSNYNNVTDVDITVMTVFAQIQSHTQVIELMSFTYITFPVRSQSAMLDVSVLHRHNAHVQTSQTQEGPALPRRLRFYILSGSRTFMQAICVSDTHVSFLMHPQGWPQQHGLQAFSSFFFPNRRKKKNAAMAGKSISCLRVLWIGERRRGGGGEM